LFQIRTSTDCAGIVDVNWIDDRLAVSNNQGSVLLYNFAASDVVDGHVRMKAEEYQHHKLKVNMIDDNSRGKFCNNVNILLLFQNIAVGSIPPIPGSLMINKRIESVRLCPSDSSCFLTLENLNIHLWDVSKPSDPVISKRCSNEYNFAAEWSLHNPNLVMVSKEKEATKC
jgi:hypothetical protein